MLLTFVLSAIVLSFSVAQDYDLVDSSMSAVPVTQEVDYECMFINSWSGARHPIDYPSNAHWSPPVMIPHEETYHMWQPDVLALPGVQRLAETGSTTGVTRRAGEEGQGNFARGFTQFNRNRQNQTLPALRLTPVLPLISGLTMIAPSPDWFTGIDGFDPRMSGMWLQGFTIDTYPWDSGTDDGDTYDADDVETDPHVVVFRLTADTVPSTNVLLNPQGTDVLPVARWQCNLLTEPCGSGPAPCVEDSDCCNNFCLKFIGDEEGECYVVPELLGEGRASDRRKNLFKESYLRESGVRVRRQDRGN